MRRPDPDSGLYTLFIFCVLVSVLLLVCGGLFAWIWRDGFGLGPERYTSRGKEAWSAFFDIYFPLAYVSLFVIAYGFIAWLLGRRVERSSPAWVALVLLSILSLACCIPAVSLVSRLAIHAGQPSAESAQQAVDQCTEVVNAIQAYHAEQGRYPSDLTVLVPEYLMAIPDVHIRGGEVVEYLPMPSLGEPFTFYVYGHTTERNLRRVWEDWELRYCRPDLCTYSSDHYPIYRIGDWVWVYRPESRPLLALPIAWIPEPEFTPLPGWRYPTSEFLVDVSAFPDGWKVDPLENTSGDPTVDHMGRKWGRPDEPDTVRQSIWRGYTVAEAEAQFDRLRAGRFEPSRPLPPYEFYLPFEPPEEISFQSRVADEFYLACGWWDAAYCEVVARYCNYVVELQLQREAEREEHVSSGLTYAEIETVIKAMDGRFVEVMGALYGETP